LSQFRRNQFKLTQAPQDKLAKSIDLPTTDKLKNQISAATGIAKSNLVSDDPQKAPIKTELRYEVKMSVSASGNGNALESSLKQSSKIQESLKSQGLNVKVSASADKAVSQKKITTKEQAKSNGISYKQLSGSQSSTPTPSPPPSSPSPSSSSSSPPATEDVDDNSMVVIVMIGVFVVTLGVVVMVKMTKGGQPEDSDSRKEVSNESYQVQANPQATNNPVGIGSNQNSGSLAWSVKLDPQSGREYYVNSQTRQTTWDRPPELDHVSQTATFRQAQDPTSGRTYYINTATRQTVWQLPAGADLI
jgi:hypothetical protein